MLIVEEDPGNVQTVRKRELQQSKARSWASSVSHRRLRIVGPRAQIPRQLTRQSRSFAFYRQHLAIEWSGWRDYTLWTSLAPSIASTYGHVMQGLVAISGYVESLDTNDKKLRVLSVQQGQTAITWLNENYSSIPQPVLLVQCIIITAFTALVNDHLYNQALQMQWSLIDNLKEDDYGLITLMKMQRSRYCQMLDPLPLLRTAIIRDVEPVVKAFDSLWKALKCLEDILNRLALQARACVPLDKRLMEKWTRQFFQLHPNVNHLSWMCVKAASGMSIIQVETMYAETETVYDQYLDVFCDVADVLDCFKSHGKNTEILVGLDGGVLSMFSWAANWCRDPGLRQRLISGLHNVRILESVQGSDYTAHICDIIRKIEEEHIFPPPTSCSDIPESNRVRIYSLAQYAKLKLIRLDFLRAPYNGPPESVWWNYDDASDPGIQFEGNDTSGDFWTEPDYVVGPAQFISRTSSGSTFTLKASEFYFTLPRL